LLNISVVAILGYSADNSENELSEKMVTHHWWGSALIVGQALQGISISFYSAEELAKLIVFCVIS
jgi:hypothetical protein